MKEDVVCEPILNSQRKPIETGIPGVPPACIYVVHCEGNSFPKSLVVEHQQRAIEQLELIVPEDVKDSRLGCSDVTNQLDVVSQYPKHLPQEYDISTLASS